MQTYCFGLAASMGAFLLGAGAKGKRYSMPNARIMIHQPLGGASGQAVDIEIQVSARQQFSRNLCAIPVQLARSQAMSYSLVGASTSAWIRRQS